MNAKILLMMSLMANVALVAAVAYLASKPASSSPSTPQDTSLSTSSVQQAIPAIPKLASDRPPESAAASNKTATSSFDWRRVESPDYREYIANLRAIGCPEKTLRDIIVADVNELYKQRAKQQAGATNRFEYWKGGNILGNLFSEESVAKNQELSKEKRALLKTLLGDKYTDQMDISGLSMINPMEQMLDFLTPEKQTAALELEQKYAAKLMKNIKSAQDNNSGDVMRQIMTEKNAEMLQTLTPEEKFEYDLRLSNTSMAIRMRMGEFEPTEQEFREMFKLQKSYDDTFAPNGMDVGGNDAKRTEARNELQTSLKTLLGDERYRTYKYDSEWQRSSLRTVTTEYNVPKTEALKVFEIRDTAQEHATQVRNDKALDATQRQSALNGIRAETEKTVGQIIGQNAMNAYLEKGDWIKRLNK